MVLTEISQNFLSFQRGFKYESLFEESEQDLKEYQLVSFNISFSVGLIVIIFLSFCVYENIFISQSFVINISLDIECTLRTLTHPEPEWVSNCFPIDNLSLTSSVFYDFSSPWVFSNYNLNCC